MGDLPFSTATEATFGTLLESAPDAMVIVDQAGRMLLVNAQTEQLFGYPRQELLGSPVEMLMPERFRNGHIGLRGGYLAQSQVRAMGAGLELCGLRKDGGEFPAEISLSPLATESGILVIAAIRDVTGRQQVVALRESETRLRAITTALPDLLFVLDEEGRYLEVLTSQDHLLYADAQKLKGRLLHEVLPQEAADMFLGVVRRTLAAGQPQIMDYPLDVQGGRRYFEGRTAPLPESPGEQRRIVWISRDITERKQAEEGARQNAERLRYVVATSPAVIYSTRIEKNEPRPIWVSENVAHLTGWTPEEALAPNWWVNHLHPEDRTWVLAQTSELFARDRLSREFRFRHRDGTYHWVRDEMRVLRDSSGQPAEVVGAWTDITEHKHAEAQQIIVQKVREQVWRMRGADDVHRVLAALREGLEAQGLALHDCGISLVDVSVDPPAIRFHNITREREWKFTDISAASEHILEIWRTRKVIYRPDLEAQDPFGERERIQRYTPGIRSVVDVSFTHGTLALNSTQPNAFSEKDLAFLQQLAEVLSEGFRRLDDLKALETTEAQYRQAQKLESIGQLAGGVAHDFNNLLTVVTGYCELLLRRRGPDHPDYAHLQEIQIAAGKGAGLVRQLLAFSRKQVLEPRVLNLNSVVRGLEKMLGPLIGEDVELVVKLASDLGQVKADPGQLEQVLVNLVVNARDAMPQGGKLTIETSNVELDPAYAANHTSVEPGSYVLMEVSDTGAGMDAATQARIFEPFFTTKEPGKGTGLGLATVYGIVKQSGGYIWVYSEPGYGTALKIYLPRLIEEAQPVVQEKEVQLAHSSETVLLVEDEAPLRQLAAIILREQGYTVLEAGRGEEALSLSAQHQGPIHAVVSDMVMPGMSGPEVVEKLRTSRPGLKVIFVSGYSADIVGQRVAMKPGTAFLQKPFKVHTLLLKLREALDS